jgi:hypothetical protein
MMVHSKNYSQDTSSVHTAPHLHSSIDADKAKALKQAYATRIQSLDEIQFISGHKTETTPKTDDILAEQITRLNLYLDTLKKQKAHEARISGQFKKVYGLLQQEGASAGLETEWQHCLQTLSEGMALYEPQTHVMQWVRQFLPGWLNSKKMPTLEHLRETLGFWQERERTLSEETSEANDLLHALNIRLENHRAAYTAHITPEVLHRLSVQLENQQAARVQNATPEMLQAANQLRRQS